MAIAYDSDQLQRVKIPEPLEPAVRVRRRILGRAARARADDVARAAAAGVLRWVRAWAIERRTREGCDVRETAAAG